MKMIWIDSPTSHRCALHKPIQITSKDWDNTYFKSSVQDMGYVLLRNQRFHACIYGSIHPDCPPMAFNNIDEAKRYVEQQALAGLAINRLTR